MRPHFMIRVLLTIATLLALGRAKVIAGVNAAESGGAAILVGPNVLVSQEQNVPHVELMAAVNPVDAKNILGGAIAFTRPDGSTTTTTYASFDGGYTWSATTTPEVDKYGAGDPQVGFGKTGSALYTTLAFVKDAKNQTRAALLAYRSTDGGRHFGPVKDLHYSYDHEQLITDYGSDKYAGRIYLSALYSRPYPLYEVGVFHSSDDGRTFTGPVLAASGHRRIGINGNNLLVFSDGVLFVPYTDFPYETAIAKKTRVSHSWFVTSADGGVSFTRPRPILMQYHDTYDRGIAEYHKGAFDRAGNFPRFAVDDSLSRYRDRLYALWEDQRSGNSRLLFIYSTDRGRSWSTPQTVGAPPASSAQFQPAIAVNDRGVVGISWFDTRASNNNDSFEHYFSASLDGGVTFLPPKRVSSEASFPRGGGNIKLIPSDFDTSRKEIGLRFLSAFSRWGNGGDYMGLAAGSDGTFHPFWADARSGTYLVYTAQVKVIPAGAAGPPPTTQTDLTKQVTIVMDRIDYDKATGEMLLPVHLKNISNHTVYGPLSVRITSVIDPYDIEYHRIDPLATLTISNADNGKRGAGAVFSYASALRDFTALEPGAQTEAVVWRIKVPTPSTPYIGVAVSGYLPGR